MRNEHLLQVIIYLICIQLLSWAAIGILSFMSKLLYSKIKQIEAKLYNLLGKDDEPRNP